MTGDKVNFEWYQGKWQSKEHLILITNKNIRLAYSILEAIPYMKPMKPITDEKN